MKKKFLLFVTMLVVLTISVLGLVACGGSTSTPGSESESGATSESESGTTSESESGVTSESESGTTSESESGATSESESETPTVTTYEVKFVDEDGTEISSATYEEGATITVPQNPANKEANGYSYVFAGWDSEVSATATANATYTATYTKTAIEYTVTFKNESAEVVGTAIFSVENTEITEPEIPAKDYYTGAWVYDLTKFENQDATLVYTAIEYTLSFVDGEGNEVLDAYKFTVENIDQVVFPEVPAENVAEGYTGSWDIGADDLVLENCTATIVLTAKTYTVTLDANGGSVDNETISVTYNEEYTLPSPTITGYLRFVGWVDEEENEVALTGEWTIASDVTLTAVYTDVIDFEDEVIPGAFSIADTTKELVVVEKDGGKVLQLTNSKNAPAMKVTIEFLKQYFDDEDVDYIAFEAIADVTSNNFRRDTNRDNALTAVTYEQDMTYTHPVDSKTYATTGIRTDAWKTFYFSRADYNFWVSQGVTSARFIASGGFSEGNNIYLDNIRPVTAEERKAGIGSFESGGVRVNDAGGKTLLFYTLDQGSTWQFNMQVSSGGFTNVGYTNANVTDGITALTFTKPAGNLSINFPGDKTAHSNIIAKTGYWALDVYVPADSDAKMTYHIGNWDGVTLKKGAWSTIYVADSKNQIIISDTTGGTYLVDNIRSITANEYALGGLSFEANVSGLRTKELGDDTTSKGVCYYYGGADHAKNVFSFAIAEGNAENDVATLTNVSLSSDVAYDGTYSLKIERTAGYMYLTMRDDSKAYEILSAGFTFWVYSTTSINGTSASNFINGCNGKFNGGEGINIPANTWTQVTVTVEDMNPTRFLIIQGSVEGTIYLDCFEPLA